jgi:hypothetical protein
MSATVPPRTRRSRFGRPNTSPNIQITDRDIEILAAHARYRFLRSSQVVGLFPDDPPKKLIERIGQLQAAGFLDRPPAQIERYRPGGGSRPIVHALANRGAALLAERADIDPGRLSWERKNHRATRPFVDHTLDVADVAIAFQAACRRRHPLVRYLAGPELVATLPEPTRTQPKPFKLTARIAFNGQQRQDAVIPDHAFALVFGDGSKRAFLVEVDRGKMPVARRHLNQTSILRKALAYEQARRSRHIEKRLGWKACRVLFITHVTTSEPTPKRPATHVVERAATIRAMLNQTPPLKGSPLFLTLDKRTFDAAEDVLALPWLAADGSAQSLLP